jgi:DNA-3-methyladenine glycosylase I
MNAAAWTRTCGGWVDGQPIVNHPLTMADIPAQSELSRAMSRDLRKRGFTFIGPVVVLLVFAGAGLINDHLEHCPAKYATAGSR